MRKEFPGYFANDPVSLKAVWERCLFVFDANVLLDLYRYSDKTSSEFFEIFKLLADRVWVPNQVAREYLVGRVAAITQQVKVYEDSMRLLGDLKKSFENPKQHPFISEKAMRSFVDSQDLLVEELRRNKNRYLAKVEMDDIKAGLEDLLRNRVGPSIPPDTIEDLIATGKLRYEQKVPPGFKDFKKGGDSDLLEDRLRPYGDYIVWKQTIAKAKDAQLPVIFVTGDSKEDWWTIYSGKPIAPHPKLVEEFVSEVGQEFFMCLPEIFMEKANEHLNRETLREAVDEIVDARVEEPKAPSLVILPAGGESSLQFGMDIDLEQAQLLVSERGFIKSQLAAIQKNIKEAEASIKSREQRLLELTARREVSIESGGEETSPHSRRLSNEISSLEIHLAALKEHLAILQQKKYSLMDQLVKLETRLTAVYAGRHELYGSQ